ncbi:hypothetical protein [Streptomyces buecherae]|uniref:Uncharacterized protein n=1 Tax=Streptomyces buecherae TaxID=2763006 RepID=A0A7H8N7A2_9ACTN|nr:hypothetical protein [Streptomyces buecherae]QKW50424.1 hypothetical protein HUT08_13775 [Streptomyces buecherae]
MNYEGARGLAAALDVQGGALAIQGGMVRGIVAKWGGESGNLSKFPAHSTWSKDQATDIRRRLGILGGDPEYALMMATYTGVIRTWEDVSRNGKKFAEDARKQALSLKDSQAKTDALAAIKTLSVWKGIAAYRRIKEVWDIERPLRTTKSLLELSNRFAGAYLKTLAQVGGERPQIYTRPWGAAAWMAEYVGWRNYPPFKNLKFQPLSFMAKAPGKGFFDKAFVPLTFVAGVKEVILPTHKGGRGIADRSMGFVQAAGAGGVMYGMWGGAAAASAIPVVGWVAIGVAGAYFLGSWGWDKWGDDIKAGTKKAWKWTTKKTGEAWNATKRETEEAWDGTKKMAKKIFPGRVKKIKFW